jgi:dipeptide/tripeptide permease
MIQLPFLFKWFYLSINIGALVASSVLVWIQENVGWEWGFGIPTVTMGIAVYSRYCFILTSKSRGQSLDPDSPGGSCIISKMEHPCST